MALDEDRILKMKRDVQNAASCAFKIEIIVNRNGEMGVSGPYGDKALFMRTMEQAMEVIKANAKDRGTLIIPGEYGDAKARPEGYF